jgi:uncharacterized protein YicC (UPF0701 family)
MNRFISESEGRVAGLLPSGCNTVTDALNWAISQTAMWRGKEVVRLKISAALERRRVADVDWKGHAFELASFATRMNQRAWDSEDSALAYLQRMLQMGNEKDTAQQRAEAAEDMLQALVKATRSFVDGQCQCCYADAKSGEDNDDIEHRPTCAWKNAERLISKSQ